MERVKFLEEQKRNTISATKKRHAEQLKMLETRNRHEIESIEKTFDSRIKAELGRIKLNTDRKN